MVTIERARPNDARAVIDVIRAAFAIEAARYGVEHLPPMLETAEEVVALMADHVVLKAVANGCVIGTVRGRIDGDTCEIGRLAVASSHVGKGIGQSLMHAIETCCPASRYTLFTGSRSDGPLHIYRKLGYVEVRREPVAENVQLIYMEKRTKHYS